MAVLYHFGRSYLQRQVPIDNGGVAGIILNNLEFKDGVVIIDKIRNVELWASYVKEVLFNTSRLRPIYQNQTYELNNVTTVGNPNKIDSILMIFWLITFVILLFLLYLTYEWQYLKDKKDKKKTRDFRFVLPRARRRYMCRARIKRAIALISVITVLFLWTIFLALLCTTQYLISSKLMDTNENGTESYASISDATTMCFQYLNNFFDIITNKTGAFLGTSIHSLNLTIRNQLNTSIVEFGGQILVTFNITEMFNTAKILLDSFTQVISSMTFIKDNCQNILADVNSVKGSVSVFQNDIDRYLNNICNSLNNSLGLQNTCRILKIKNNNFKTGINTDLVDPNSSTIILFVLREYHLNITDIARIFYQIDTNLQNQLSAMLISTIARFDVSSYLSIVTNVWAQLVSMLSSSINSTKSYDTVVNSALDAVSKYENLVAIILIFLTFISVLLVLLLSFRDSIQDRSLSRFVNFGIQIFFILVITMSALFCISVLIVSNFSQSEICNQINTTGGVNVLDQMINDKLAIPWNTKIKPMLSFYKNINISIAQPMNILTGIKDRCRNTSMGLFSVMGMGNFVNFTAIVRSPSIISIVNQAGKDALTAFLNSNPEQIIPKNLTKFISQSMALIGYFEGINYNSGIQELQKPLVGIVDFTEYFNDLSTFAINSSKTLGWTNDLIYLNNTVNQLLATAPNWTNTQRNMSSLAQSFQILQNNRNNSSLMNALMTMTTNLKNLFNNPAQVSDLFFLIYNNLIAVNLLNTVDQLVSGTFNVIIYQMLPCGDLSMIFEALTTSFCSYKNFNVSLAAFGLMLLSETIICQIISILVMLSTLLRLNYEGNVSKC